MNKIRKKMKMLWLLLHESNFQLAEAKKELQERFDIEGSLDEQFYAASKQLYLENKLLFKQLEGINELNE